MGFVSEELNETEKQLIKDGKASNMAVVYGKEASIWKVRPADPQPQTVETAPQVVKKELPLEYCPRTPPLPAPTLCNKFKRLHPPPSLVWIPKH